MRIIIRNDMVLLKPLVFLYTKTTSDSVTSYYYIQKRHGAAKTIVFIMQKRPGDARVEVRG